MEKPGDGGSIRTCLNVCHSALPIVRTNAIYSSAATTGDQGKVTYFMYCLWLPSTINFFNFNFLVLKHFSKKKKKKKKTNETAINANSSAFYECPS
jgi:hypothetical protein